MGAVWAPAFGFPTRLRRLERPAGEGPPRRGGPDADRVKARIAGADPSLVIHNEVLTALDSAPRYRLALLRVDPPGPEHDEVRYLENPFAPFGHRAAFDLEAN